ncbi:MAG: amino acid ABC transporter permease [Pyramidobacter sp.]|nr:amino acid ABC transporter permease [Pyramidobacter sp.]
MTFKIAVVSMLCTLALSLVITLVRYYRIRGWCTVVDVYVDLFRDTPLLVQLFFIYYGLPQIFPVFVKLSGYTAAVIGLTLNAASYMTEDMRGALESVPQGQIDGGLSVGMTDLQVMRHIILPQAAKVALPVLGNEFVSLVKNSSMAFTLGVREIMAEASLLGTSSSRYMETYMDAFIIYFILCKLISLAQRRLERRLNRQRGGV